MIVGLDIGTTHFGISLANEDLKYSIFHRPKSNEIFYLNDTLEDLRENYEFFGIIYGHADQNVNLNSLFSLN